MDIDNDNDTTLNNAKESGNNKENEQINDQKKRSEWSIKNRKKTNDVGLIIIRHSLTPTNYSNYEKPKTAKNAVPLPLIKLYKSPSEIIWYENYIEKQKKDKDNENNVMDMDVDDSTKTNEIHDKDHHNKNQITTNTNNVTSTTTTNTTNITNTETNNTTSNTSNNNDNNGNNNNNDKNNKENDKDNKITSSTEYKNPYKIQKIFISDNEFKGVLPTDIELRYTSWNGKLVHVLPSKTIEELFFNAKLLWVTLPWEKHDKGEKKNRKYR